MHKAIAGAFWGLSLAVLAAAPARAADAAAATPPASFVASDFAVPTRVQTARFKLAPLGPALVKIDFDAYMASIEHLQKTFTRSADWPHKDISAADAMKDMQGEQARFTARESFAYAVLSADGKRERGCIYISPSPVPGYDAVARIWVTKAEYDAGFDTRLYAWANTWVKTAWPFKKVAWPGRAIDWATWDALVAGKAPN